jgi:hypothetical protein
LGFLVWKYVYHLATLLRRIFAAGYRTVPFWKAGICMYNIPT